VATMPPPGPPSGAPGQPPGGPPPPPSSPPGGPGGYPPQPAPYLPSYPQPSPYAGGSPQWGGAALPTIRAGPAPGLAYAGFWIRFASYLIDVIPIGIVVGVIVGAAGAGPTCSTNGNGVTICSGGTGSVGSWLGLLVVGVYWVLTWSLMGASLGQKALGMRVVNAANGERIDIGKAVLRFVGFVISAIPLTLGLIWAGFDARKQGWHDKIAGTFVVRQY
jgi:uncharacterized RDD family membrane protein YckC